MKQLGLALFLMLSYLCMGYSTLKWQNSADRRGVCKGCNDSGIYTTVVVFWPVFLTVLIPLELFHPNGEPNKLLNKLINNGVQK